MTTTFCLQDIVTNRNTLWLSGVDVNGAPVMVAMDTFYPSFLIKPQRELDHAEAEAYLSELGVLENVTRHAIVEATPFIGFTNGRKDKLVQVSVKDMLSYKSTVAAVTAPAQVYHADFSFANQFLHQTNFSYQDWLEFDTPQRSSGCTTAEQEYFLGSPSLLRTVTVDQAPQTKSLFITVKPVSRDGVVQGTLFHPNPSHNEDRILMVGLRYVARGTDVTELFTILPGVKDTLFCEDETTLLKYVVNSIKHHDPDTILYYPDHIHPLGYLAERARLHNVPLKIERITKNTARSYESNQTRVLVLATRSVINIVAAIKKKGVSLETTDLYTASAHPGCRRVPVRAETTDPYAINAWIQNGAFETVAAWTRQDLQLMVDLEADMAFRLEFANISRVSDTSITDVAQRGEQIRVYNKLAHFVVDKRHYINRDQLTQKPLRSADPPTCADPEERSINSQLRDECMAALHAKQGKHKRSIKKELEKEGGNVVKPAPNWWKHQRIGVCDFSSLYPTIMMAYNISYENLVYEDRYNRLPGVTYMRVAVNAHETVTLAMKPGIIPALLELLLSSRKEIKNRMKNTVDKFLMALLDKAQLSMKVLCNATYGFTGAENALLAIKEVMYIVTALGRFLQKMSSNYLADTYRIQTIYGDTDSIFIRAPHEEHPDDAEMVRRTGARYGMTLTLEEVRAKYPMVSSRDHLINAVSYMVYDKLCAELNTLYIAPVNIVRENLATEVWMDDAKKHYCYNFWNEHDPTRVDKIKVTGMAQKKREWTRWTRKVLKEITRLMLTGHPEQIQTVIHTHLTALTTGTVPIDDLTITREFKSKLDYKNYRMPHLQVVMELEKRHRFRHPSNTRVSYVITKSTQDALYLNAHSVRYIRATDLDFLYYLKKQFYEPVKKLLVYHQDLFDFDQLFTAFVRNVEMKYQHRGRVNDPSGKRRGLTLEMIRAKRPRI